MTLTTGDKVGEILVFSGQAFTKLGELIGSYDKPDSDFSSDKWTEEDIETLRTTIRTFSEDLNNLSEKLRNKAIANMKQGMKRRAQASKGLTHVTTSPKMSKVAKQSN